MKKKGFIFFATLVGLLFYLNWQKAIMPLPNSILKIKSESRQREKKTNTPLDPNFKKTFAMRAHQLAQIQEDPSKVELELRDFARSLSRENLKELAELAADIRNNQDERFLAVTLIMWSKNPESSSQLIEIASLDFDPMLSPGRAGDFERILRMLAVEGLLEVPGSNQEKQVWAQKILSKTTLTEVSDRTHRLLWSLEGRAQSPAQQDETALTKLLSQETN